jgi:hypothetical protein
LVSEPSDEPGRQRHPSGYGRDSRRIGRYRRIGIEIVASLVLLADKRASRRPGTLPWAALIAGTGASFAANVAVGGSDWMAEQYPAGRSSR